MQKHTSASLARRGPPSAPCAHSPETSRPAPSRVDGDSAMQARGIAADFYQEGIGDVEPMLPDSFERSKIRRLSSYYLWLDFEARHAMHGSHQRQPDWQFIGIRMLVSRIRRTAWLATLSAVLLALWAPHADGLENSVRVQSKSVHVGSENVRVAVSVDNAVAISALSIPLELRSVDAGAIIIGGTTFTVNAQGRMANCPFTQEGCPFDPIFERPFPKPDSTNYCSGPVSSSYDFPAGIDVLPQSPDAHLMQISGGCGVLPAAADPASAESASLILSFNAGPTAGRFVIDTCCTIGRHLYFVYGSGDILVPAFTGGVITLFPCGCACQADPQCDGVFDMADITLVIDRAFRAGEPIPDSSCSEGIILDGPTDVDCSGTTDIIDVSKMLDVVLRGCDPLELLCRPCVDSRRSSNPVSKL